MFKVDGTIIEPLEVDRLEVNSGQVFLLETSSNKQSSEHINLY